MGSFRFTLILFSRCACDSPIELAPLCVESLDGAVAAHDAHRVLNGRQVTEGDDVDAIMDLFEEEVCVLL